MGAQINNVEFEAIRIMQSHLSKRGLHVSQRKLMDSIHELLANNENEILQSIKEKKNYEIKLKKWLDNPIEIKRTNALKEHDLAVWDPKRKIMIENMGLFILWKE